MPRRDDARCVQVETKMARRQLPRFWQRPLCDVTKGAERKATATNHIAATRRRPSARVPDLHFLRVLLLPLLYLNAIALFCFSLFATVTFCSRPHLPFSLTPCHTLSSPSYLTPTRSSFPFFLIALSKHSDNSILTLSPPLLSPPPPRLSALPNLLSPLALHAERKQMLPTYAN